MLRDRGDGEDFHLLCDAREECGAVIAPSHVDRDLFPTAGLEWLRKQVIERVEMKRELHVEAFLFE